MVLARENTVAEVGLLAGLRDLVALTKPKVTRLVVFTGGVGLVAVPGAQLSWVKAAVLLFGTVLIVSAANVLNMFLERDIDGLMSRTADRPLPSGRISPSSALLLGLVLAVFAVPLLAVGINGTTGLLALLALVSYVGLYTPMKQRSWTAVLVGAIPGAMPPLMGATAVAGRVEPVGLSLFAVMFIWQVPHTLAITLFRHGEYERAGFQTMPVQRGEEATRRQAWLWSPVLVVSSVVPWLLGAGGIPYLVLALVLGAGFLQVAWKMDRERGETRWAKRLFGYSIVYLTLLFGMLLFTGRGP